MAYRINKRNLLLLTVLGLILIIHACKTDTPRPLIETSHYSIHSNKVVQENFVALAVSDKEIISNYKSEKKNTTHSSIDFKFSINGKDNEMPYGMNHSVELSGKPSGSVSAIKFGEQHTEAKHTGGPILEKNFKWEIRLDMRKVFQAFDSVGYYPLCTGEKLYKNDFKNIYIAGGTPPLSWDFVNLFQNSNWELTDSDGDHIFELDILLNPQVEQAESRTWKLQSDIKEYPSFQSDYPMVNAMYNLSLDEMVLNIEADSTFRTGKEWAGVWTRDISYSTILALAAIQPRIAMISLMKKVKNGRIIQDTGTGGSWPVSTDRTVWVLAAWEIYKVTGNRNWLAYIYEVTANTLQDDLKVIQDPETGLMYGESSFLDWREQTYPHWMTPTDIFASRCLGTNVVHHAAYSIAAEMADLLRADKYEFKQTAITIKDALNNHLWLENKGYFGQYLYGKLHPVVSPRSEALGESLSILYGVADNSRAKSILSNTPVTAYGVPCIYPQIPDIPPYHNNAVWPFVEAFWMLAAAKANNPTAVNHSLGAIYRQAALFLTNKENMVAQSGDYYGTAVNSDRQLWSVAANLAIVYRLYFGMEFTTEGLAFTPFIPDFLEGDKVLKGFKYRNSILNIQVTGTGNTVNRVLLDGERIQEPVIKPDLSGEHWLIIEVKKAKKDNQTINLKEVEFSPTIPVIDLGSGPEPEGLKIINNGSTIKESTDLELLRKEKQGANELMVMQTNNGFVSFITRPKIINEDYVQTIIEMEDNTSCNTHPASGYSGKGYVEITKKRNTSVSREIQIEKDGFYAIDFRYVNATGPINTDNNCAIRTLFINDEEIGAIIFPQGGTDEYSNWQYSNFKKVYLKEGTVNISLNLMPYNENMDGEINTAFIDYVRLIPLN